MLGRGVEKSNCHAMVSRLEAMVDKSHKNLLDKRADEFRSKKASFSCCRDSEKAESAVSDARNGKAKDITKMEKKSKQSSALLKKADKDYTEAAYLAESARQDWDMTVARVSIK
ncbi:nostrin-like isoform X3 [Elysia marginata]|uniref:Nostrin-like isoform X3 n=1 Tax=Elysia marginata TaxID=1093978 RepID=A0AAV4HZV5_9GAST|nr:nostrin-like isoform X3 [Elysia marginata]